MSVELGRTPYGWEVARRLDMSLKEYEKTLSETAGANLMSFEMLLDAYGALLTERQRQCLSLFYEEDLSLAEIGETFAISRQAVHDAIRHGEAQLHEYEAALHLVEKESERRQIIARLQQLAGGIPEFDELLQQLL